MTGLAPHLEERIRTHLERKYLQPGHLAGCLTLVARGDETPLCVVQGLADREIQRPLAEDAIFRIYSMTKPVTSVALMQQYEEGKVLLEAPLAEYLPEFADVQVHRGGSWPDYLQAPPERPITVRDLLTHTSGLTYNFMRRTNVDYGYRKEKICDREQPCTLEEFTHRLAKLPLEFSPGDMWNYSVATDVCGRLIEVLSGMDFADYLRQHIFQPLGMNDTDFHVPAQKASRLAACYQHQPGGLSQQVDPAGADSVYAKPPGFFSGGGGLVSTAADYLRFCKMLLNGGQGILGPRTIELMTCNHLPGGVDMAGMGTPTTFSEAPYHGVGFGLGFAVLLDPAKAQTTGRPGEYFWGGMASTAFWISPADQLIVIFMTQLMPSATWPVRRELRAIIHGGLLD